MSVLSRLLVHLMRMKSKYDFNPSRREFLKKVVTASIIVGAFAVGSNVLAQIQPYINAKSIFTSKTVRIEHVYIYKNGNYAIAVDEKLNPIAESTNHARVINEAISYVTDVNRCSVSRIYIARGLYKITETIKLPPITMIIEGDGMQNPYAVIDGTVPCYGTILYTTREDVDMFAPSDNARPPYDFLYIRDMGIGGSLNVEHAPIKLLNLTYRNTFLENIYISGDKSRYGYAPNYAIYVGYSPKGGFITYWRNIFVEWEYVTWPIYLEEPSLVIDNLYIYKRSYYGVYVKDTGGWGVRIERLRIIGPPAGILSYDQIRVVAEDRDTTLYIRKAEVEMDGDFLNGWNFISIIAPSTAKASLIIDRFAGGNLPSVDRFLYTSGNVEVKLGELTFRFKDGVERETRRRGVAVLSGDGTTTDFLIGEHNLIPPVTDPTKVVVECTPASPDAIAASPVVCYLSDEDGDGVYESIRAKFASAPVAGTNNVKIVWEAEYIG